MGSCWEGRKLCCDLCSHAGARRVRCPFGYCPAIAACAECRKSRKDVLGKAAHVKMGCDKKHAEHVAWEQEREELIRTGRLLRTSAISETVDGEKLVKVWFREQVHFAGIGFARVDREFYMAPGTYDAIPLLKNATIEDYMAHGFVLPKYAPDVAPVVQMVHRAINLAIDAKINAALGVSPLK